MAGHSKWANIKHRKAGQDAKRSKVFTKIIRELVVAAKKGDNLEDNPTLRTIVDKALSNNMKRDTIDKAIVRGAGNQDSDNYEFIRYEGYGPNGLAVIVDCLTDNKQRTVAEVRHIFSRANGNLGTDGSVAYLFEKKGIISYDTAVDADKLFEFAIEIGCKDVEIDEECVDVIVEPSDFLDIKQQLIDNDFQPTTAEITMDATIKITIDNSEDAQKVLNLIEKLEELDDVQNVYTNADFDETVMQSLFSAK